MLVLWDNTTPYYSENYTNRLPSDCSMWKNSGQTMTELAENLDLFIITFIIFPDTSHPCSKSVNGESVSNDDNDPFLSTYIRSNTNWLNSETKRLVQHTTWCQEREQGTAWSGEMTWSLKGQVYMHWWGAEIETNVAVNQVLAFQLNILTWFKLMNIYLTYCKNKTCKVESHWGLNPAEMPSLRVEWKGREISISETPPWESYSPPPFPLLV